MQQPLSHLAKQKFKSSSFKSDFTAAIKSAALFIGTTVGAGLASGREIVTFFGEMSPLAPAFTGLLLGAIGGLFMWLGLMSRQPHGKWLRIALSVSSLITLAAMYAACESLGRDVFGLAFFGFALAGVCAALTYFGVESIKAVNVIIVPLIIVLAAVLYFMRGSIGVGGKIGIFAPIAYSAMNMLLGGELLAEDGKKASPRSIVYSSLISSITLGVLLFFLGSLVRGSTDELPTISVAASLSMKTAAGILLLAAIFTTALSANKVLTDEAEKLSVIIQTKYASKHGKTPNKCSHAIFSLLPAVISFPLSFIGFDNLVDYGYPLISAFGVILVFNALYRAFGMIKQNRPANRQKRRKRSVGDSGESGVSRIAQ